MRPRVLLRVDCPGCDAPCFVPPSLATLAGTVRCSWCRTIIKRDTRPWWWRLAARGRVSANSADPSGPPP